MYVKACPFFQLIVCIPSSYSCFSSGRKDLIKAKKGKQSNKYSVKLGTLSQPGGSIVKLTTMVDYGYIFEIGIRRLSVQRDKVSVSGRPYIGQYKYGSLGS